MLSAPPLTATAHAPAGTAAMAASKAFMKTILLRGRLAGTGLCGGEAKLQTRGPGFAGEFFDLVVSFGSANKILASFAIDCLAPQFSRLLDRSDRIDRRRR